MGEKKTAHAQIHLSIAASEPCGTYKSHGGDPEGSGSHDDEGLGAVGCQRDAFVSARARVCVCVYVSGRDVAAPESQACWIWWVEALMAQRCPCTQNPEICTESDEVLGRRREGKKNEWKQIGVKINK